MTDSTKHFGFTVLGSGSEGNATVIHCPDGNLLLDAGFSRKELYRRLDARCIDPATISAVLVTHSHSDHCKGLQLFANELKIPAYETTDTAQGISCDNRNASDVHVITPGSDFSLCGARIHPFAVSHDVDAVGYTFHVDNLKLGYATDLGFTSLMVLQKLCNCNALILESNYDKNMLIQSPRPLRLKRRISSKTGHLSNEDSMNTLVQVIRDCTKSIVFAHLSRECNRADIVQSLAKETLNELHRTDISISIASQQEPLQTQWILE